MLMGKYVFFVMRSESVNWVNWDCQNTVELAIQIYYMCIRFFFFSSFVSEIFLSVSLSFFKNKGALRQNVMEQQVPELLGFFNKKKRIQIQGEFLFPW